MAAAIAAVIVPVSGQDRNPAPRERVSGPFRLEAHRGICHRFPENTRLSFREAAREAARYGGMETDVQRTSDGVLVCMHDNTLDRTTNAVGKVSDYTFRQLRRFRIDGGYGWDEKWSGKLKVPTFKSYLKVCKKAGFVPYVELKLLDREGVRATVEMVHSMGFTDKDFVMTSFRKEYLIWASEFCNAPLEYMQGKLEKYDLDECVRRGFIVRPNGNRITEDFVKACHAKGLAVECYGLKVGDAGRLALLKEWGVLGITCNDWKGLE